MFCALLTSRYQVSVYRTNGPLVLITWYLLCHILYGLSEIKVYILGQSSTRTVGIASNFQDT